MTLMQRRRTLMAAQGGSSNVLFEWDYTEGTSKLTTVAGTPVMQSDGLLLQNDGTAYSMCGVAPNITPISGSYVAEITYSDIVTTGKSDNVDFCHYNSEQKRTRFAYIVTGQNTPSGMFTNARGNYTTELFTPSASGKMFIEFDSNANSIKFTNGQNTYSATLNTPSAWSLDPRIVFVQKGESAGNVSVKLQHIKIVKKKKLAKGLLCGRMTSTEIRSTPTTGAANLEM